MSIYSPVRSEAGAVGAQRPRERHRRPGQPRQQGDRRHGAGDGRPHSPGVIIDHIPLFCNLQLENK